MKQLFNNRRQLNQPYASQQSKKSLIAFIFAYIYAYKLSIVFAQMGEGRDIY